MDGSRSYVFGILAVLLVVSASPILSAAQEMVDPRSGRLLLTVTDLVLEAGAVDLELQRSLDTRRAEQGLLGTRWRMNWEARLFHHGDLVVVEQGPTAVAFTRDAGKAEHGAPSGDRLVFVADRRAIVSRADGSRDTFDPEGRLVERDLRNGNRITLRYGRDGQLVRVDGPRGAFLQLVATASGRVDRVESSSGAVVRYSYRGDALVAVHVDGALPVRYAYGATGALERIEHPRTGAVDLAYDPAGRVVSRRWADGGGERFEYDDGAGTRRHIDAAGSVTVTRWRHDTREAEITDPLGHRSVLTFDAAGRLLAATGPDGAAVRVRYDALGRTAQVESPGGQVTRFEYVGRTPLVKTIARPDGTRHAFEYDARGNLERVTLGAVEHARYTYHPDGLLATAVRRGSAPERYVYDADGRLQSVTDPAGATDRFEYDPRGNLVRETNALGGTTVRAYDARQRLVSLTDPVGNVTRYEYDAADTLTRVIDPMGQSTQYAYDARGRLRTRTDPAGRTERYEYDAVGRLLSVVSPEGAHEAVRYDVAGRAVESAGARGRTTTVDYDPRGRVIRERGTTGLEVRYTYDPRGLLSRVQEATGGREEFQRDASGRIVTATGPAGGITRFRYDAAGNLLATTDPRGQVTSFTYTPAGTLASVATPTGDTARYEYDAAGRLIATHRPAGGVTRLAWDAMGNLLSVTDPAGNTVRHAYDLAGRRVSTTDAVGRLTRYVHDPAGRLTEKQLPDRTRVRYAYDAAGNLAGVDDGAFPVRFHHDAAGRIVRTEYPSIGKSVAYEYDASGLRTKVIDPSGRVTRYEHDARQQLSGIVLPDGNRIELFSDAHGRLASARYPNGVTRRWEYDGAGRTTKITDLGPGSTVVAAISYAYDAAGNPVEIGEHDGRRTRLTYDPSGQLTEVAGSGGTHRYRYLAGGNRGSAEASGSTIRFRHDTGDRLVEAGGERLTYDEHGNLVERAGPRGKTAYEYDVQDRLVKVVGPAGETTSFGYAPTGERVWKRDGTGLTYYVYDGLNLIQEIDRTGAPKASYVHGPGIDRPLAMERDGRTYYYHADRLGSIRLLTDGQGRVAAGYEYDAFGTPTAERGSAANPFRFTGREWEPGLGLFYYRARYYDPRLGRFLSVDPLPPRMDDPFALNPYLYVRNSPARFTDPLGLENTEITPTWSRVTMSGRQHTWPGDRFVYGRDPYWQLQHARWQVAHGQHGNLFGGHIPELEREVRDHGRMGRVPRPPGQVGPGIGPDGRTMPGESVSPGTTLRDGGGAGAASPGTTLSTPPRGPRILVPGGQGQSSFVPGPPTPVSGSGFAQAGAAVLAPVGAYVNYRACLDEGRSTADCIKAGAMRAAGGGLVSGGAAAGLAMTPLAPAVPFIAAGVGAAGVGAAGHRWVNAPEVKAADERRRQQEHALTALLPRLKGAMEAKVAALEGRKARMLATRAQATGIMDSVKTAAEEAVEAWAKLKSLEPTIGTAAHLCKDAPVVAGRVTSLAAEVEQGKNSLTAGLQAARTMMGNCTRQDDADWVKRMYEAAKGLVAVMVVKSSQALTGNDALTTIHGEAQQAQQALADARALVARIASGAARADQGARDVAAPAEDAATAARQLPLEAAALQAELDRFTSWFPAVPPENYKGEWPHDLAAKWRARVWAAGSIPFQDMGSRYAEVARQEASRANAPRLEADALVAKLAAQATACNALPTTSTVAADAEATAKAAVLAMELEADLVTKADACIARLTAPGGAPAVGAAPAPGGIMNSLMIHCNPKQPEAGVLVTCTAMAVFDAKYWSPVDVTAGGGWVNGPNFMATTPGPVSVSVTRHGRTDTATVMVVAKPSGSAAGSARTGSSSAGPTSGGGVKDDPRSQRTGGGTPIDPRVGEAISQFGSSQPAAPRADTAGGGDGAKPSGTGSTATTKPGHQGAYISGPAPSTSGPRSPTTTPGGVGAAVGGAIGYPYPGAAGSSGGAGSGTTWSGLTGDPRQPFGQPGSGGAGSSTTQPGQTPPGQGGRSSPGAATTPGPGTPAAAMSLAGYWDSNLGCATFRDGSVCADVKHPNGATSTIASCAFDGSTLRFTWSGPNGSGTGELRRVGDSSLSGSFTGSATGSWSLSRRASPCPVAAAAPAPPAQAPAQTQSWPSVDCYQDCYNKCLKEGFSVGYSPRAGTPQSCAGHCQGFKGKITDSPLLCSAR